MATRSDGSRLHVQPLSQIRGQEEIEKGKVGGVLQQFQVHEDTALAYKMQSAEYKNHVSRNKDQRKSVRAGIKTAKETYLDEVKNAGILPDNSVAEIEQKEWLAEELNKRIEEQENLEKTQQEIQRIKDEEVAMQMQRDEEKRLRYLEHKRQQRIAKEEEDYRRLRRVMKELQEAELSDPGDDVSPEDDVIRLPKNNDIIVLADGTAIDARHNEIQTEEQIKEKMERRDEELAKLLQEQENHQVEKKRTMHEDYRKAIEMQDREIAKHLQRQEKAKAERRREKQMRRAQSMPERDELTSAQRRNLPTYHEAVDDFRREDVPPVSDGNHGVDSRKYSKPDRGERPSQAPENGENDYDEIWHAKSGGKTKALTPRMLMGAEGQEPGGHFDNIAETLDPTFQRVSRRTAEDPSDEEYDRQGGGKSAPIVPPLKRKTPKGKKGKK